MTAFSSPQLTSDQVAQYEREGYTLVKQPLFAPEKFARLQAIFEENLTREGSGGMDMIHTRDARLLEFLLSDEVLDLIEPVIGPNIGLWASHFISKDPHTGKATPWHEDSAYWNGQVSTMERICTVWLFISNYSRMNAACTKRVLSTVPRPTRRTSAAPATRCAIFRPPAKSMR
jgi:hypothetical protein